MRYRFDQTHEYRPPPCPVCGGTSLVGWVSVDSLEDKPGTWFTPGVHMCERACEADGAPDVVWAVHPDRLFAEPHPATAP